MAQPQPSPSQLDDYQHRLRAQRFDHAYWDAPNDSLRRVLAGQRADTSRLQTLTQLFHLTDLSQEALPDLLVEHREALRLATRLGYSERVPLRLVVAFDELALAPAPNLPAMRDTLLAALRAYDALGGGPQPYLLEWIKEVTAELKQPEANRTFFSQRLAHEQQRGNVMNTAICYRMLGSYFGALGDYNQAISQRLRAAELFRTCSAFRYYNELGAIGIMYTEWGNHARALPFLQKALTLPGVAPETYYACMNHALARAYFKLGRYAEARRCNARTLRPHRPPAVVAPYDRALGLVQESAILLALGRPAATRPLLLAGQHLVDSLHLPLRSYAGYCELQANWARYYAATGQGAQALHAWQTALHQARQERQAALTLDYLRSLAASCQQQGQPARAATYGLAALALADTLEAAQAPARVARYEFEQDDRLQQQRLERLRRAQQRSTAQVRQQTTRARQYGVVAGALLLLLLGGGALLVALQRSRRRLLTSETALRQANKTQQGLMRIIGHDLRGPVAMFQQVTPLLRASLGTSAPRDAVELVEELDGTAQHVGALVDNLLDWARLQGGLVSSHPVRLRAATAMHSVVQLYAPIAQRKCIAVSTDDATDVWVWADLTLLTTVLRNLLANAIKFTPVGGAVAVTARATTTGVRFGVQDSGRGMPAAALALAMGAENAASQPGTAGEPGTGLGLPLCRHFVALLGSELRGRPNDPGPGLQFWFELPTLPASAVHAPLPQESSTR